ncbi:MAG: hypothetical protein IKS72_00095, partial [Prevotella sp.]|nr:hypothetical protein [Prevotella sp.]
MKFKCWKKNGASVWLAVGMLLMLYVVGVGCTDKKRPAVEEDVAVDSLETDTLTADTIANIIEDAPLPKAVDELFDD